MSEAAPFFGDIADGPKGGHAFWLKAGEGIRIRAGHWPCEGAWGTVFLLPGRTEYIEKYGRTATDLVVRGLEVLSIDWRGQGLSTRTLDDPMTGHVDDFAEYQTDLAALIAYAKGQNLPRPWYLLAHSMGGCIGLRSLMGDHPFKAAAFSAPMWGILMAAWMRPVAVALSTMSRWFHFRHVFAPGTKARTYVLDAGFLGNTLTTDQEMWNFMRHQAMSQPELTLGGPSLGWLQAALAECHALALMSSPDLPCITGLGTAEKIVDTGPIHARMAVWPKGRLNMFAGCEHEVLMETPGARRQFVEEAVALFQGQR
jgi:lysophospholipase